MLKKFKKKPRVDSSKFYTLTENLFAGETSDSDNNNNESVNIENNNVSDNGDNDDDEYQVVLRPKNQNFNNFESRRQAINSWSTISTIRDSDINSNIFEIDDVIDANANQRIQSRDNLSQYVEDNALDLLKSDEPKTTQQSFKIPTEPLFEYCSLITYDLDKHKAKLKSTFPKSAIFDSMILNYIYPTKNVEMYSNNVQNYVLVLIYPNGSRKYAYCRRVLGTREDVSIFIPQVYCVVSKIRALSFYFNLLNEI